MIIINNKNYCDIVTSYEILVILLLHMKFFELLHVELLIDFI